MTEKYPNIKSSNPIECVSGKIMRCSRIVSTIFRKHLKPFGITNSQLTILFMITKTGGIKQQELADRLYMDKSTVNRNLKRLYDKEYIHKVETQVQTTQTGKATLETIIPEWDKAMKEMKSLLKKEGLESLNTLTQQLTK